MSILRFFFLIVLIAACGCGGAEQRKVIWQTVRHEGLVATYLRPKGDRVIPGPLQKGQILGFGVNHERL